jgi:hypothetical protein
MRHGNFRALAALVRGSHAWLSSRDPVYLGGLNHQWRLPYPELALAIRDCSSGLSQRGLALAALGTPRPPYLTFKTSQGALLASGTPQGLSVKASFHGRLALLIRKPSYPALLKGKSLAPYKGLGPSKQHYFCTRPGGASASRLWGFRVGERFNGNNDSPRLLPRCRFLIKAATPLRRYPLGFVNSKPALPLRRAPLGTLVASRVRLRCLARAPKARSLPLIQHSTGSPKGFVIGAPKAVTPPPQKNLKFWSLLSQQPTLSYSLKYCRLSRRVRKILKNKYRYSKYFFMIPAYKRQLYTLHL